MQSDIKNQKIKILKLYYAKIIDHCITFNEYYLVIFFITFLSGLSLPGQVRSGMGTYAGAARRRVYLTTVVLRPPSGHRPGRR